MTNDELTQALSDLHLSQAEVALLLGVSTRTVRRWFEGEEVPGPAQAAIRAWLSLNKRKLAWKPDSVTVFENDQDQIARLRDHAIRVEALLAKVDKRGGPKTHWTVDLPEHKATLGPIEVGFYLLQNAGFSLSTYTRRDKTPDLDGDWPLVEDAAACIATALGRWRECSESLRAVSQFLRTTPRVFANEGPKLMSAEEKNRRSKIVMGAAGSLDTLADDALLGQATYAAFEELNRTVLGVGMSTDIRLVSEVARAFHQVGRIP